MVGAVANAAIAVRAAELYCWRMLGERCAHPQLYEIETEGHPAAWVPFFADGRPHGVIARARLVFDGKRRRALALLSVVSVSGKPLHSFLMCLFADVVESVDTQDLKS